jgi:arginyl-tRNA synthetase
VKEKLREKIELALRELLDAVDDSDALPDFAIEVPRQKEHGDFSCNAAMLLAKRLRKKPHEIAEDLVRRLGDADGLIASLEIAGPGFLNIKLVDSGWHELLHDVIEGGVRYGRCSTQPDSDGTKPKVQVESSIGRDSSRANGLIKAALA